MKKFTFCVAFAALSVSAGLARSPFVLSDAVSAECMSMEKVDMPMMNRAISKPASALKFDFVKENRKHLMKKDAQIAALTAPEALPATNVSNVGFVANWNTVSSANYYEVDVMRIFSTTEDAEYLSLYEDFLLMQEYPSEVTGYLDGLTYRWDWYLYGGKLADRSIVFPQISSKGQTQLQTPMMDFSGEGETETVYFSFVAEGAVGDKIGIGYYYTDDEGEDLAFAFQPVTFEEGTMTKTLYAELPAVDALGFLIYTDPTMQNTGDVKLKTFLVSREFAAGTEFMEVYDYRQTAETSASFFTIEKDTETEGVSDEFVYGVYALNVDMNKGEILDMSDMSDMILVGATGSVEGVKASREKIFVHDKLHVVLDKPETVSVYNMAGVLVASYEGVEGDNEFSLPASGVYIVKAGNTIAKVMK